MQKGGVNTKVITTTPCLYMEVSHPVNHNKENVIYCIVLVIMKQIHPQKCLAIFL